MAPAELDAIEARAAAATSIQPRKAVGLDPTDIAPTPRVHAAPDGTLAFFCSAKTDVAALVAEVRRLRGLVLGAVTSDCPMHDGLGFCVWCKGREQDLIILHRENCPAFNPDGGVK